MLRTFRAIRLLRSCLSAAVALALSANVLEAGQADVHDHGDASWITPAGASVHPESQVDSLLATAAPLTFAQNADGRPEGAVTCSATRGCETHRVPGHVPDGEGLPHHAQHVDHCGHAHLATLTQPERATEPRICPEAARAESAVPLRSIALRPSLRPPIV